MHREIIRRYKVYGALQHFRIAALISLVLFFASVVANFYAGIYATNRASNYVEDIVLSNTPVVNVDFLFVYGTLLLIVAAVLLCAVHPKRIPFVLHALTLFYFIRATFVSLTHLGPFPDHALLVDGPNLFAKMFSGADLFFSGHTGVPFLLALIFWQEEHLRYLFLAWSGFFAVIVLLGHLHYSIDVLAAFFITFTIYQIALWLFPRDRALFLSDL